MIDRLTPIAGHPVFLVVPAPLKAVIKLRVDMVHLHSRWWLGTWEGGVI